MESENREFSSHPHYLRVGRRRQLFSGGAGQTFLIES
jgi:hypothetical protein